MILIKPDMDMKQIKYDNEVVFDVFQGPTEIKMVCENILSELGTPLILLGLKGANKETADFNAIASAISGFMLYGPIVVGLGESDEEIPDRLLFYDFDELYPGMEDIFLSYLKQFVIDNKENIALLIRDDLMHKFDFRGSKEEREKIRKDALISNLLDYYFPYYDFEAENNNQSAYLW